MSSRKNYWSNSKFADWLRGTEKLEAGTSRQWRNWRDESKTKHPIRYWVAEEALDRVQDFIWWPVDKIYSIKYYINNRWVTRTHALTAHPSDIRRGHWYDLSNRFLPCMFNELRDFVEVELAWWHLAWEGKEERKKYNMPWWAAGWWRVRSWRCPQAGLDNLAWQMNLKADDSWGMKEGDEGYGEPTLQAKNAAEILALYKWWTEVYPNRPDPYDVSGWHEICNQRRESGKDFFDLEDRTEEEQKETTKSLGELRDIEEQYRNEDTEMMIRLIRVRDSLWT